jgi:tetratricopeptide (TPR) repeat protein
MQEIKGTRTITARCPTHNIDIGAEGERIVCPQGPHALAQHFPDESFWEYCCDCQRFRPSEINQGGQSAPQCSVCGRQVARRYLCGNCKVMSIESDDRTVKRKQYTFTDNSTIAPACPGCADIPSGLVNRHECEETAATFTTPRDNCPFCDKPIKIEKRTEQKIQQKSETKPRAAARVKGDRAEASKPVGVDKSATTPQSRSSVASCPHCGLARKPNEQFCADCGFELDTSRQPSSYLSNEDVDEWVQSADSSTRTQQKTSALPLKMIFGVVGAIALLGILLTIGRLSVGGNSIEKKLDKAIAAGSILGPANENAHDLYNQLRNSGASEETLKRYREKLTPLLTQHGYRLTTDLLIFGYDEPDATDWQEAGRALDWSVELNPGNAYMSARAAYCSGRAAYVQKQSDRAVEFWTRAASLDKSWALPVNGIGLIYNSKRDYSSARSYFSDAINREPNWAVPYENMGNAYYMEKNRNRAREFYNQAMSKAPDWAKPHVHLADMALEDNDYTTAVSQFEKALDPSAKGLKSQEINKIQERLDTARQHLSG